MNKLEDQIKIRVASPVKRYLAYIVDLLIIVTCISLLRPLFLRENWDLNSETQSFFELLPLYILGIFVFLSKDLIQGRSLGKRLFNLRVSLVDKDYTCPSAKWLLIRNLPLLFFPIEIFLILRDKYCQRFGDKISGTFVIEINKVIHIRDVSIRVIAAYFILGIVWLEYYTLHPIQIKKTSFYKLAIEEIKNSKDISQTMGNEFEIGYWPDIEFSEKHIIFTFEVMKESEITQVKIALNLQDYSLAKIFMLPIAKD